jgi:hypothetical protein
MAPMRRSGTLRLSEKSTDSRRPLEPDKPTIIFDDVFFDKAIIKIGSMFKCAGMRDHAALWKVSRIQTFHKLESGRYRMTDSEKIVHLNDIVHLHRVGVAPGNFPSARKTTLGSLRYSAIWRLVS